MKKTLADEGQIDEYYKLIKEFYKLSVRIIPKSYTKFPRKIYWSQKN